jgi:hypothetical protein
LLLVLIASSSFVAFARGSSPLGELVIFDSNSSSGPVVTVGGQPAFSGRTLFESDVITTPESMGATLSLGTAGTLRMDPNTTFSIGLKGDQIVGDVTSGSVTVLNATSQVSLRNAAGQVVKLSSGESAGAASSRAARDHRDSTGKCIDDDNDGDLECDFAGIPAWGWFAIAGAAAAIVIVAIVVANDDDKASPVR